MTRNNLPKVLRKQAVRFGLIVVLLVALVGIYVLEMQHNSSSESQTPTQSTNNSVDLGR